MDQVPEDVLSYLRTFMDYNTRLNARAINSTWLKCINMVDFKFFFTTEADLPKIVDHLSRKKTPISVAFPKCPIRSYDAFLAQITRLTGLTGLELPNYFLSYPGSAITNGKKVMVLSTLTNLKSLTRDRTLSDPSLSKTEYFLASEMYKNFKNLTSLEVMPREERRNWIYDDRERVEEIIKQNKELRKAHVHLYDTAAFDQSFVDAFGGHKHLTELNIITFSASMPQCNIYDTFSGLKSLSFVARLTVDSSEQPPALFGQLTNLERLIYRGAAPLVNIDKLEKLTSLILENPVATSRSQWQKIYRSLPALKRLKTLDISIIHHDNDDYQFLAHLPSLEQLRIKKTQTEPVKTLGHLTDNPNLTKLILKSLAKLDFHELARISGTLLDLDLGFMDQTSLTKEDMAGLASLTKLTKLHILDGTYRKATNHLVENFSNLKELIYDNRSGTLSLKNLTNLECIATKLKVASIEELAQCTHLTYLRCDMEIQSKTDCGILSANLQLKVVVMDQPQPYASWWHMIGQLTSLEHLVAYGLSENDMDDWDGLTKLTRLAMLEPWVPDGTNFRKLKALERLASNRTIQSQSVAMLPHLYEISQSLQDFRNLQQKV